MIAIEDMPPVRVIIVNYNAGEALLESVASALAGDENACLAVVDNASTDRSIEALESRLGHEPRLEIRRNTENLGFARAVNQIAGITDEPYLLVLNPDCVLQTGALAALVEALEQDPGAGVAGPWVTNSEGRVQKGTWRRFPDPWRALMTFTGLHRLSSRSERLAGVEQPGRQPPATVTRSEAVSGACMLLRRSAAREVGYFDEQYAMHCEDLDLMYRLAQAGFHCLLVPSARVVHLGGVSSASRPWWVHRQKHLGMQHYFSKFQADDHALPVRCLVYAGIWCHYLATLPMVALKRIAGPA